MLNVFFIISRQNVEPNAIVGVRKSVGHRNVVLIISKSHIDMFVI